MWLGQLIAALVVIGLGMGVIVFSWDLQYFSEFGPGPGFLPRLLGFGITICGIVILIKVFRNRERSGNFVKPGTILGVKFLGLIMAMFLLFPLLGFSVGLALLTGVTMRVMGSHGWVQCLIVTVVVAIGVHYVFAEGLTIPIPQGLLGW
jgi:putative tricarboxylic transport membrane protein